VNPSKLTAWADAETAAAMDRAKMKGITRIMDALLSCRSG
jgi:hypothetical protein